MIEWVSSASKFEWNLKDKGAQKKYFAFFCNLNHCDASLCQLKDSIEIHTRRQLWKLTLQPSKSGPEAGAQEASSW